MTTESANDDARTMTASEFRARCLALMDEVAESGEPIVITKRGKPVARLIPCEPEPVDWFGRDRDIIQIHGDIISPIDVEWEAESDPDRVLFGAGGPITMHDDLIDPVDVEWEAESDPDRVLNP